MLDHHRALIYTMVIVSAAESDMPDAELRIIGDIVGDMPVFRDFDQRELPSVLNDCTELISRENGLEETLKVIKAALPAKLRETAYAIACDLVASHGEAGQEELRVLELLRHRLNLEPLIAAAIERGARARFRTL
jgi:tellurite resistance protein